MRQVAAGMGDLQFGFFEYAWVGVPITVAGILYMVFIGRHLLPKTDADDFNVDEVEQEIEANETSKTKKIICGIIMLGVIITMATGFVPLEIAAVLFSVSSPAAFPNARRMIPLIGSPFSSSPA